MDYKILSEDLRKWFEEPEHMNVVHYAIERGMSKEELFGLAKEDEGLRKALWYGLSVQEYKIVEGVLSGEIDRGVGLRMLETYNGWKGEVSIVQNIEESLSPEVAGRLASAMEKLEKFKEGEVAGGFGEVISSSWASESGASESRVSS